MAAAVGREVVMTGGAGGTGPAPAAGDNADGVRDAPAIQPAPRGTNAPRRQAVPRTKFAEAYRSMFTMCPGGEQLIPQFRHLNCNYLSTKGHAPSLLELKQHTQALVILLKQIAISTSVGVIDNENPDDAAPDPANPAQPVVHPQTPHRFNPNEAFDFLNDLNTPYENNTVHHNLPLVSLLNTLEKPQYPPGMIVNPSRADELMEIDICPLHPVAPAPLNGPSLPYATHEALLKHANEVLELIDHEYSAKGGLLGVLPHEEEGDRPLAETTLLGQMILYIQRLVARLHTLERVHANAMDVMKGEAVVPFQALSRVGPDGRTGREVVYPQDRFVLVNAGDDVWGFLNETFESKERTDEQARINYLKLGVEGEKLWENRGGREYARGITYMDITTRYYRLRNDSLKTIFVIPAYSEHPGTKVTRDMENQPTVVSVVKPVWPERVSVWEKKVRDDMEELRQLRMQSADLHTRVEELTNERTFLLHDNNTHRASAFRAREELRNLNEMIADPQQALTDAQRIQAENLARIAILDQREARLRDTDTAARTARDALVREQAEMTALQQQHTREYNAQRTRLDADYTERLERLQRQQEIAVRRGQEVADEFQRVWEEQIGETQVLVEFLESEEVRNRLGEEVIPREVEGRALQRARVVIDRGLEVLRRPLGGLGV